MPNNFIISYYFSRLASLKFQAACQLLSSARAIITDRLHGHILALLLGKPLVFLNNNNGKLKNFYQTWTRDHPLVHFATSHEETISITIAPLRETSYSQ
ncbi:MAG: polysaccharide pyruvyl transferase family protein [Deltaproteobacteria bacterium]|nr:polysaccharide pyruvyl transferase family protein [Deltaproteobacteria bacterium]